MFRDSEYILYEGIEDGQRCSRVDWYQGRGYQFGWGDQGSSEGAYCQDFAERIARGKDCWFHVRFRCCYVLQEHLWQDCDLFLEPCEQDLLRIIPPVSKDGQSHHESSKRITRRALKTTPSPKKKRITGTKIKRKTGDDETNGKDEVT